MICTLLHIAQLSLQANLCWHLPLHQRDPKRSEIPREKSWWKTDVHRPQLGPWQGTIVSVAPADNRSIATQRQYRADALGWVMLVSKGCRMLVKHLKCQNLVVWRPPGGTRTNQDVPRNSQRGHLRVELRNPDQKEKDLDCRKEGRNGTI